MKKSVYVIKKLFLPFRPKLILEEINGKIVAKIKIMHKIIYLDLVKRSNQQMLFKYPMDFIEIDVLVKEDKPGQVNLLVDTPIGHFRFLAKRI